jgi:hypothetical protein
MNDGFVLTAHAEAEMTRRQIPKEWLDACMASPEQTVEGSGQRKVFQSRFTQDGKTFLLRVIVETWHTPPVVVTVYRTTKLDKYLEPTP